MEKNNNISLWGKAVIIFAAILAIIMVSGKWLDLYQVPMIFGDSIEHEYSIFEIADFIDTFNMYLDSSDVSLFTAILSIGAVVTIILNILMLLFTLLNLNILNVNKTIFVTNVIVSIILAGVYLGAIVYINSEMKEATYGGIEELLRSTSNPYWLIVFSILSFVGTKIKKTETNINIVQKSETTYKIKCSQCGSEIDKSALFCNNCGAAISTHEIDKNKYCTECGAKIEEGVSFCSECGNRIE